MRVRVDDLVLERAPQRLAQLLQLRALRLPPPGGDIENVDGLVRLGVDQHHLNVAALRGDGGGQIVEQTRPVLCHDLDQGRAVGRLRVE